MSLGIAIKGPEGIVLAAESRVTLMAQFQNGDNIQQWPVNFDNATKLRSFGIPHQHVGAVTYGQAVIGQRTAHSFLPELEQSLSKERLSIKAFAVALSEFYMKQWNDIIPPNYVGPDMTFIIGGYDKDEPYGDIYIVEIPHNPTPIRQSDQFGISFGGQKEIVDRLLIGYDTRLL